MYPFLAFFCLQSKTVPASFLHSASIKDRQPSHLLSHQDPSFHPDTLANNWKVSPVGKSVVLPGDLPGTIVFTQDGSHFLVNTCGYNAHSISLVDFNSLQIVSTQNLGQAWLGLANSGSDVFVSGGSGTKYKLKARIGDKSNDERGPLLHLNLTDNVLSGESALPYPLANTAQDDKENEFTSGLLFDQKGELIVLNTQNDTILKLDQTGTKMIASGKTGYRPYGVAESPDKKQFAVSHWGDKSVGLYDVNSLALISTIKVDAHPTSVLFAPDGRLFVANAGSNGVSVISDGKVTETIRTTLQPEDRIGSTPCALAITPDGKTLFVANANNNDVAMVDISESGDSKVEGFIPTANYPCALAVSPEGNKLLIGTGKGLKTLPSALPEDEVTNSTLKVKKFRYVLSGAEGRVNIVDIPNSEVLKSYTEQCLANRPDAGVSEVTASQKEIALRGFKQIEHVIYIIKENRSYDQVFGDLKEGNGDPNLVMFGNKVTPNIHSLATSYTLMDNLYTDGETSQVGHQWTDAAYCNDYAQKQMLLSYSGRKEIDSDARLFTSPGGYIWQDALNNGKTMRIFGEYLQWQEDHTHAHGVIAEDPEKYGCSAAFEKIFASGGRDTEKAAEFISEMKVAEKTGKWPNLMVMALNEDHTKGLKPGDHSPTSMVASNDQAVGMVIEALSKSTFWKNTAVFIIEDDSQNGADHVDAQRTEGLVISPFVKRNYVDHTHYSTSSMLSTMEIILGLPPMSQFDALATPMYNMFTDKADLAKFHMINPMVDLDEINPEGTELAKESLELDWSDIDRADPDKLNAILWHFVHPGRPVPPPVHGHIGIFDNLQKDRD